MVVFFILGVINPILFVLLLFMAYFVVPGIILSFYNPNLASNYHTHKNTLVR